MSYEGYEMYLCANGHLTREDALAGCYFGEEPTICTVCKEPMVWRCCVDQTNDGGVAPVLVEHEAEKTKTCECCGHTRVTEEATFCIPSNAGHRLRDDHADEIPAEVPLVEVQFKDVDSGELFPTADEAWRNKGYHR